MTPARERLVVVLAVVLAGAGAVLASTQTFASATVTGVQHPIAVPGQQAAPALAPLGVVGLALGLALTIARRVGRTVLGAVLLLLGAAIVAIALPSLLDDAAGTRGAISAATGVTDVAPLVVARTGSGWPLVAVASGALAAALGVVVLVRGHRWAAGGRRFDAPSRPAARDPRNPIAEWDALTRGSDPTDGP